MQDCTILLLLFEFQNLIFGEHNLWTERYSFLSLAFIQSTHECIRKVSLSEGFNKIIDTFSEVFFWLIITNVGIFFLPTSAEENIYGGPYKS